MTCSRPFLLPATWVYIASVYQITTCMHAHTVHGHHPCHGMGHRRVPSWTRAIEQVYRLWSRYLWDMEGIFQFTSDNQLTKQLDARYAIGDI